MPPPATAQTVNDCVTLGCDNQQLAVQIIPDPDFVHTGTCQTVTPCGNGDLFRQMYYKVRLVYIPGSSLEPLDFNLDYREINVDVQALITGTPYGAAYSFIDVKTTNECHRPGQWMGQSRGQRRRRVYRRRQFQI